jgi:uncharacterized protein YcfJ
MRQPNLRTVASTALLGAAFVVGGTAAAAEFATVVSSTPVTASVPVPRQVCSDGQQLVQPRPSGAGALIGAIAGGVIGHNLGYGAGQAVATGLGAITGAAIGSQVEANATPPVEVPVRRCQTVSNYENRVVGYDVVYEYAGQRYSTRMARDPGAQLAVSVQPLNPSAGLPVPADADAPVESAAPPARVYRTVPRTVYYEPVPPVVYVAPVIGFGLGYYGGYDGGHRGRHWR